jgi:Zn finger protein HypA/HybF involved in hydrogenase expression
MGKRKYIMERVGIRCMRCYEGEVVEEVRGEYYCERCGRLEGKYKERVENEREKLLLTEGGGRW